jgi:hypothetical protein
MVLFGGFRRRASRSAHNGRRLPGKIRFIISFMMYIVNIFMINFKGLWRLFRNNLVFAANQALKYHGAPPSRAQWPGFGQHLTTVSGK